MHANSKFSCLRRSPGIVLGVFRRSVHAFVRCDRRIYNQRFGTADSRASRPLGPFPSESFSLKSCHHILAHYFRLPRFLVSPFFFPLKIHDMPSGPRSSFWHWRGQCTTLGLNESVQDTSGWLCI